MAEEFEEQFSDRYFRFRKVDKLVMSTRFHKIELRTSTE